MTASVTNLGIEGLDQVEQIGTGGSSRVYRARQVDLDRVVAVKVLNLSDEQGVSKRFDRERKAMGRLSLHEGIVPVYSSGVTNHGEPYLVMPYYANGSLQDQINTGPMEWRTALSYIDVAAETIAAAHDAGVVHLDLKPANILLTNNGAPRIADFGIAKISGTSTGATTGNAAFTPAYSAPETFLEGDTGPPSDVYGLAATLWALIVGHPPFLGPGDDSNLMSVIGRVVNHPVGDLRGLAPSAIADVVERAMAKQASDRYQTASEFSIALKRAYERAAETTFEPSSSMANSTLFPDTPVGPGRDDHAPLWKKAGTVASSTAPVEAAPVYSADATTTSIGQPPLPVANSAPTTISNQGPQRPHTHKASRPLLASSAPPPAVQLGLPDDGPTPFVDLDRFRFARYY